MKQNPYGFKVSEGGSQNIADISREVFNPYDEILVFTSLRPNERAFWKSRECLPGRHRFLPHGHYIVQFKCGYKGWARSPFGGLNPKKPGEFIEMPVNFGASIGEGLTGDADKLREKYKHNCPN